MQEIVVEEVKNSTVRTRILGIEFIFGLEGRRIKIISKYNPTAQVRDASSCWVPDYLLKKAKQQAYAILKK